VKPSPTRQAVKPSHHKRRCRILFLKSPLLVTVNFGERKALYLNQTFQTIPSGL